LLRNGIRHKTTRIPHAWFTVYGIFKPILDYNIYLSFFFNKITSLVYCISPKERPCSKAGLEILSKYSPPYCNFICKPKGFQNKLHYYYYYYYYYFLMCVFTFVICIVFILCQFLIGHCSVKL
jgi:hypothetical protein